MGEAAPGGNPLPLTEEALLEQLNRGYVCPPSAGPLWRAAHHAGVDMSLIEDALQMTPLQRLREHQRSLNLVLALEQARLLHDSRSRSPS